MLISSMSFKKLGKIYRRNLEEKFVNMTNKGMSIEFKTQTILLNTEEIQQQYPELIPAILSYISKKTPIKKKPRKKRKTVGSLIAEIIDSIETE